MSAGRKRLEDALLAGKTKDNENDPDNRNSSQSLEISGTKELDFGDIMGVFSLHFSQNSLFMAAGCGNGSVQVYSIDTGRKRRPLKHGSLYGLPVTSVKFLPYKDNRLMSTTSDGTITCWDLDNWCNIRSVDEMHNEISALDFSHDGKTFATTGKDHKIRVYESDTMQLMLTFAGSDYVETAQDTNVVAAETGHGRKVFSVKFHPYDNNVFMSGGWDRCLKIWDVRVDNVVRSISGPYICGDGIDVSQDDILTASWLAQNAMQVWDYGSGRLIENIPFPSKGHGEFLYCCRFMYSDMVVAGGSGTNDTKVISRKPYQVMETFEEDGKPIQALDVHMGQESNLIALGGTGPYIKLVTLEE